MLSELHSDLSKVTDKGVEYHAEDILRVLQFSYGINYDDKDLWFKLYHLHLELLNLNAFELVDIFKIICLLGEL